MSKRYQASREGFFGTSVTTVEEEELGLGSPKGPNYGLRSPRISAVRPGPQELQTTTTAVELHPSAFAEDAEEEEEGASAVVATTHATTGIKGGWLSSWFGSKPAADEPLTVEAPGTENDESGTDESSVAARRSKKVAKSARKSSLSPAKRKPPTSPSTKPRTSAAAFWQEGRTSANERRSDVRPGMYHHHAVLQPLSWKDFVLDKNPDVIDAPSRTTFTISGNLGEGDTVVLNPNSAQAILLRVEARHAARELAAKEERMQAARLLREKEDRSFARKHPSAQQGSRSSWKWVGSLFKFAATTNDDGLADDEDTPPAEHDDDDDERSATVDSEGSSLDGGDDAEDEEVPEFKRRYLTDKGRSVSAAPISVARSLAESFDGHEDGDAEDDLDLTLAEGSDFGENGRLRWKRRLDRLGSCAASEEPATSNQTKRKSARRSRRSVQTPLMLSPDGASPQPLLPDSVRLSKANLSPVSATSSARKSATVATTTTATAAPVSDIHGTVALPVAFGSPGSSKNPTPRGSVDDSVLHNLANTLRSGAIGSWDLTTLGARPAGVVRIPQTPDQIDVFGIGLMLSNKLKASIQRAVEHHEPKNVAEEALKAAQREAAGRRSQKGKRPSSTVAEDEAEPVAVLQPLRAHGLLTEKSNQYVLRTVTVDDLITILDFQLVYFGRDTSDHFKAAHDNANAQLIYPDEADANPLPLLSIPVATMPKSELLEHAALALLGTNNSSQS